MNLSAFHLARPRRGEEVSGDVVVFRSGANRSILALVDALGHGPAAHAVATTAERCLLDAPIEDDVVTIQRRLHDALARTRGAAAMVCSVEPGRLTGCGVGNVELRCSPGTIPVVLSPGILGSAVRNFRQFEGPLPSRVRLVLLSDGISTRLSLDAVRDLGPQQACASILEHHGYSHDDASVLVVDVEA